MRIAIICKVKFGPTHPFQGTGNRKSPLGLSGGGFYREARRGLCEFENDGFLGGSEERKEIW